MLKVVRVEKSPDWPDETWFRLFKDDELINNIRVDDEIADDLACCLVPTSTADKLPPEGEDILWWYPRPHSTGNEWRAGYYTTVKNYPPGCFSSDRHHWFVCDGPTWWMFPPPSPEREGVSDVNKM